MYSNLIEIKNPSGAAEKHAAWLQSRASQALGQARIGIGLFP
ncbi:MAG: hypothetical protein OXS32_06565 [Verrucomicrobiales bacterium]|nr:hypothetical protein [Verrucomicrobiales bacterium]